MSNLRIFWIIWCSFWALGWLVLGFFTLVTFLLVPLSILAILIPVGAAPRQAQPYPWLPQVQPPCVRCGQPFVAHVNGQCPLPPGQYPPPPGQGQYPPPPPNRMLPPGPPGA